MTTAYTWWQLAGRPTRDRYGVTVPPTGNGYGSMTQPGGSPPSASWGRPDDRTPQRQAVRAGGFGGTRQVGVTPVGGAQAVIVSHHHGPSLRAGKR